MTTTRTYRLMRTMFISSVLILIGVLFLGIGMLTGAVAWVVVGCGVTLLGMILGGTTHIVFDYCT